MNTDEAMDIMAEQITEVKDIVVAVQVLAGAALLKGDRRLYEHLYAAVVRYENGEDLGWSTRIGQKVEQ